MEKIINRFLKEDVLSNNEALLGIEYKEEKESFLEMKKIENIKNEIKELFEYFINIYLIKRDKLQFGLKKGMAQKERNKIF